MTEDLAAVIEDAWERRENLDVSHRDIAGAVEHALQLLDSGNARVAEPDGGGGWRVNQSATLRRGEQARLATALVVREDSLTLFGFADDEQRDTFGLLQSVAGIGPRMALATLAVLAPDDLARALLDGDVKALTRVPGIGPKVAQRMVLELKDKVVAPGTAAVEPVALTGSGDPRRDQVVEALGGHGELVRTPGELKPALERAFSAGKPALVNVLTDPTVVYPRKSNLA